MFYPEESLKRGGRFYLCWVADSWPLRFAAITHRQLWSQDIRKLCADLLEVMTNESGRPSNRFSLRLSSQLLRGLVRLYERKVSVFLGDLCMIQAHIYKHANKKFMIRDTVIIEEVAQPMPQLPQLPGTVQEEPEEEQVEELIRNSGNVVANVQDITLKEAAIPEFQLPPNDGFGEEHPNQPLQQLLADRTVEMMLLQPETSAVHHSGLEIPDMDKSHDKSRIVDSHQMEQISELDMTLLRKSAAEESVPGGFEKDIHVIPEIPLPEPELPAPPEKRVSEEVPQEIPVPQPEPPQPEVAEPPRTRAEPEKMKLEELEEMQPRKRRGKTKLIIDKRIKLSADFLRTRIDNPNVELRCEDPKDDLVDTRVPCEVYMRRPAHAGCRFPAMVSDVLTRLFQRNLGVAATLPLAERDVEEIVAEPPRLRTRSVLEKIVEEEESAPIPQVQPPQEEVSEVNAPEMSVLQPLEVPRISIQEPIDIADMLTQQVETLTQVGRKRAGEYDTSPKRARLSGYVSFRESHRQQLQVEIANEPDKENIPPKSENVQQPPPRDPVHYVSVMLQEAGIADIQQAFVPEVVEQAEIQARAETQTQARTRGDGSSSSETPLGSLDRTKVSLGDSVKTTDSQRFIRTQWGIDGTMVKILYCIKGGVSPLTVEKLIAKGPVLSGYRSIIAARCFTSILKLKQHAFIKIVKNPETLEIKDIILGPIFDGLQ